MKATALAALALLSPISASETPQTAHLTFLASPSSSSPPPLYALAVLADNTTHATPDARSRVARIAAPDYNAAVLCDLDFALAPGARPPERAFVVGDDGHTGQVVIDPPTAVRGVRCAGTCVANYGTCNGADGRGARLCCNGYCAADLCRPWDGV